MFLFSFLNFLIISFRNFLFSINHPNWNALNHSCFNIKHFFWFPMLINLAFLIWSLLVVVIDFHQIHYFLDLTSYQPKYYAIFLLLINLNKVYHTIPNSLYNQIRLFFSLKSYFLIFFLSQLKNCFNSKFPNQNLLH